MRGVCSWEAALPGVEAVQPGWSEGGGEGEVRVVALGQHLPGLDGVRSARPRARRVRSVVVEVEAAVLNRGIVPALPEVKERDVASSASSPAHCRTVK